MGLTIQYLENVGKKMFKKKHFLGCFPADIHPKTKRKIFSLIFNLSKHNEEGTHYIAIFANAKTLMYFDPFGKKCKNKHIKRFIANNKQTRKIKEVKRTIQSLNSNFCGFFCLAFILSQELKIPLSKFFKMFHNDDLNLNDDVITEFIISKFIDQ